MTLLRVMSASFWLCALGAVVLYGFFVVVASVPPAQVAGLSAAMAAIAAAVTVRNLRIGSELADPGGNPHLRRARNKLRERRGF
jgi:hypothetical protein